jgi:hypothetical protein
VQLIAGRAPAADTFQPILLGRHLVQDAIRIGHAIKSDPQPAKSELSRGDGVPPADAMEQGQGSIRRHVTQV